MDPKLSWCLDAPGTIDRRNDDSKHADSSPRQRGSTRDAKRRPAAAEGIQLPGDEVELGRKVLKDEVQNRRAPLRIGGRATQENASE